MSNQSVEYLKALIDLDAKLYNEAIQSNDYKRALELSLHRSLLKDALIELLETEVALISELEKGA